MDTSLSGQAARPRAGSRSRLRIRALTVLAAAGAAAAGWAIAGPLTGIRLAARLGSAGAPQHIGLPAVIAVALLAGLAGWASLAAAERFTRRPRLVWTALALAVLLLSLTGPLAAPAAAARTALAFLHLLVGGVVIGGLRRSMR